MFAGDAAVLADFGLKARKARAPPTTEQKAAAKAKAEATREARGTKGPKAKKAALRPRASLGNTRAVLPVSFFHATGSGSGVRVLPLTGP